MFQKCHNLITWTLVFTTIFSPAMVYAQVPEESAVAAAAKPKPDLDYITPDAVAGIVVFPRAVLTSAAFEAMPIEVLSALGKKELGIDPAQIDQAIAIAEPPTAGPPGAVVILKMAGPIGGDRILAPLWSRTTEDTLDGKTYRKGKGPFDASIYQADEKTLIVGTDALLRKVVAVHAAPADGKLKTMLAKGGAPDLMGVVLIEPLRPIIAAGMMQAPLPPQLSNLREVPNQVKYVAFKASISDPVEMMITVRASDEAAAQQIESTVDSLMAMAEQSAAAEIAKQEASSDPVEQAQAKYAKRMSNRIKGALRPVRKGASLTLSGGGRSGNPAVQIAVVGILIGLLLPAINAAREAGRRAQSMNNMRQIMLGMVIYDNTKGNYPPQAICDAQGKPLLSWRVAILPYIEQEALYKQFHLDEPWDSPNNRPLIAQMPKVFQNPSSPMAKPGMANYLAVCGNGLMFEGTTGRKAADIRDGLSHTIAVVEADDARAVEWTKPQDWDFNATKPLAGLGHAHPGGFGAAFGDGSVHFISASIDPTLFHALLTIAGNEPVEVP